MKITRERSLSSLFDTYTIILSNGEKHKIKFNETLELPDSDFFITSNTNGSSNEISGSQGGEYVAKRNIIYDLVMVFFITIAPLKIFDIISISDIVYNIFIAVLIFFPFVRMIRPMPMTVVKK